MNKYLTELIGTFFLVLTLGCTVIGGGAGVIPPLAIGAAVMGLFARSNLWIYLLANLLGGAVAAAVFKQVNPKDR